MLYNNLFKLSSLELPWALASLPNIEFIFRFLYLLPINSKSTAFSSLPLSIILFTLGKWILESKEFILPIGVDLFFLNFNVNISVNISLL